MKEKNSNLKEKVQLIKICGHYVLSSEEFKNEVKSQFPNIDSKIKIRIKGKLNSLCD